jgi:NAD/NADP transhydrogenase alpha subunit
MLTDCGCSIQKDDDASYVLTTGLYNIHNSLATDSSQISETNIWQILVKCKKKLGKLQYTDHNRQSTNISTALESLRDW